jgi:hypothetical protein
MLERLVMAQINTIIPNRSTDDAISIALHTALAHLDKKEQILENTVH